MGLWSRLLGRKDASFTSLDLFRQFLTSGREAKSGVTVTTQRSLEVATVLACCKVIAEGIAQVPWRLYREQDGSRIIVTDNSLSQLISRKPNRWQTSFEFRETLAFHAVLCGNFYAFIGRVGRAREIRELIPIEPGRVTVNKVAGDILAYDVRADDGATETFPAETIWHLRGPSWNGWLGMEATRLAREAIGLSIATEEAHATFHKNGAKVSGLLAMKDAVGKEKFEFLAAWLDRHAIGGDRENKPMILDLGADFKSMTMTGVDAQHLETRKHQISEICRAFRVLAIMIGHGGDQAPTFASAEQFFLAHVVHTLLPWYERIQQSGDANLLSEAERAEGYYTKFIPNALMRGASTDRASFYAQGLGSGGHPAWLTPNDVREFEDMERSTDEHADELFYPVASTAATEAPAPADGKSAEIDRIVAAIGNIKAPIVNVAPAEVNVRTPDVKVDVAPPHVTVEAAHVDVHPPAITVEGSKLEITIAETKAGKRKTTVTEHDKDGRVKAFVQEDA